MPVPDVVLEDVRKQSEMMASEMCAELGLPRDAHECATDIIFKSIQMVFNGWWEAHNGDTEKVQLEFIQRREQIVSAIGVHMLMLSRLSDVQSSGVHGPALRQ